MNIQNKIIEIVNNYDYEKEVEELVSAYEKNPIKEGEIIPLRPRIDDKFLGDQDEIARNVARQIITYRIREKAFMKLFSKGVIHPVNISEGQFRKTVVYETRSSMTKTTTETSIHFPKSIFTDFMKV